ncbi:MAG TPA: hypothetical protein VH498_04360 [Candidatus Dormibacteraeota bacterium]|nr:hypothetical protein [Candidatus Dormibacteraeota bacterium]
MKLIDRDAPALPVPLGDATPVRLARRRRRWLLRRHGPTAAAAGGCVAAVAGAMLLLLPAPVSASLNGDRVEIGAMTLGRVAAGADARTVLYGGDASYALSEPGDGTARAAASWMAGGVMRTAACTLHRAPLRLVDECSFDVGSGALTCIDVLDLRGASTWQRTYSDGQRVEITIPPAGAAIPVPFPIGR